MLRGFRVSRAISVDIPISGQEVSWARNTPKTCPHDPTVDSAPGTPSQPPCSHPEPYFPLSPT